MTPSFLRLAHWEWRRLVAERSALLLTAVWCVLLAFAAHQGLTQTRARHAEIAAARTANASSWATKRALLIEIEAGRAQPKTYSDPRSPTNSIMGGAADNPIVLEPAPLSAFAAGPGDLAPSIRPAGMITKVFIAPQSIDNPANRLAGPLDFNFVVAALLPLFVLALGFDVLAREREARTMPLLACQPVALGRIVAARFAVHFVLLWLPLAAAAALTIAFSQAPAAPLAPALGELALWLTLAAAYLVFWQALAAWANFHAWPAATNALVLSGAWLAAVLLIPTLVQAVVQAVAPPPDRRAFVLETRAIETDLFTRAEAIRDAYYAENPARRPTVALNEYDTYFVGNLYPRALAADAALAPTLDRLAAARAAQATWWRRLAWLSPTLAFRLATEQLAGATPVQQGRLIDHARAFQQTWRAHFGLKLFSMRPLTLADYDGKPEPTPVRLTFAERSTAALPATLGLFAAWIFAVIALRRTSDR